MTSGISVAALTLLLAVFAGCRTAPRNAVDSEMASCVPANAKLLAGIHIDQVRANPVLQKLFADSLSLLAPARNASLVLVTYTGTDLLWAARGNFSEAPPGATLLGSQIALTGSDAIVRAAAAQHARGRTGAPALVAQAEAIAKQPVWAVALGSTPFPFSGNAANLNRLLSLTDYTTLALDAGSRVGLHAPGIGGSADRARRFEETLRGLLSLARAAARDRDIESVLAAVQIRRDDLQVRVDTSAAPETIERLLRSAAR